VGKQKKEAVYDIEGNNNKVWNKSENCIKNVAVNIVGENKDSMLQPIG